MYIYIYVIPVRGPSLHQCALRASERDLATAPFGDQWPGKLAMMPFVWDWSRY